MFSPLDYIALKDEYQPPYSINISVYGPARLVLQAVLLPALDRWRWTKNLTSDTVWDEIEPIVSDIISQLSVSEP